MSVEPGRFAGMKMMWGRWRVAWNSLFVALVSGALILTLLDSSAQPEAFAPAGLFAALMLVWYATGESQPGQRVLRKLPPAFAYFLMGWLLWYGAVSISPFFFIALFALFPQVFIRLPMVWAIVLAVALNGLVLVAIHRIDSNLTATWMIILTISSLSGSLLGLFVDSIIRQSEERRHLIAELEATRETLAASEFEAGMLHERQRLAGELHDTIIQGMVAIVTQLEAAENASDTVVSQHHIERAKTIARDDLQEARRFIWMTEKQALTASMLERRLDDLVRKWSENEAVSAEVRVTGQREAAISPQTGHTLFRAAQEALTNISKHAQADRATVTLSWMPDSVLLDVNDDGKGFTPETTPQGGFGLLNMRRRVEASGGALTIESEIGSGTTLVVELPLSGRK